MYEFSQDHRISLPALTVMIHMIDGPLHYIAFATELGIACQNIYSLLKRLQAHRIVEPAKEPAGEWQLTLLGRTIINQLEEHLAR